MSSIIPLKNLIPFKLPQSTEWGGNLTNTKVKPGEHWFKNQKECPWRQWREKENADQILLISNTENPKWDITDRI